MYFISFTDDCIVTCRIFRLYYWRVRLFRFCLTDKFDCYWVIVADKSNCEGACDVGEIAENNLNLDSAILLFILFFIALILSLKLFIIAYRVLIVTGNSAIAAWFEWSNWSAIDANIAGFFYDLRSYLESIY